MNIFRKNSFVPQQTPGFRIVPFQPVRKDLSRAVKAGEGDMIELSYSKEAPTTPADVMTPITRIFQLPDDGSAHSVMATGRVDDAVKMTVDGITESSTSGKPHDFELHIGDLSAGLHMLSVVHTNINYDPPSGNISLLSGTVGPCPPVTIVPDDNEEEPCECSCEDGDDGGSSPSGYSLRSGYQMDESESGSSSAGCNVIREAGFNHMRWSASFGVFRGMGGIPKGRLELMAYLYDAKLLTPAGLTYRHPAASCVLMPDGGIAPNQLFRVDEGGSYTNYVCDANGTAAFGVGSTSSKTNRAEFVTALSRESGVVTTLAQAAYLRIARMDGSATFYSPTTGEFAGYISSHNALLTAQDAEEYLTVLREEDGTIRQIWNLWDGLADIVPAETGYVISLYLPGQVTGLDETTGLYTFVGNPFKTFAISGEATAQTLTVTERDSSLPESVPPFVTTWTGVSGTWSMAQGTGDDAIVVDRVRTEPDEEGIYQVITTVSKGGIPASCTAESYFSHPTGELLLSSTDGYGSKEAQTTVYDYDDAGRLISITSPGGGETRYVHDAQGRVTVAATPWAGGSSQLVETTYLDDGSAWSGEPAQIAFYMVDAAGISHLHRKEVYSYHVENHVKRVEKRSTANGMTRLEVTETWQADAENPHARGRVRMRQEVDGIQTWYDYVPATQYGALYTVIAETRVGEEVVVGQSSRSIRHVTAQGNTVRTEEHILLTSGDWALLDSMDYEFDEKNRWIKKTRGNGRVILRTLMCSGDVLSETDEDGVLTTYGYDSARQLVETIRSSVMDGDTVITPETITSYLRDALGRVVQKRTDTGSMTTITKTGYDLLGRELSKTDELGRVTSYVYSADGLTVTETTPTGATLVTVRHADGSIIHEHGTGQRELYHVYDWNGGRLRETVKLADQTTILSQTLRNGFGEVVVITSPTTAGFLYDRSTYNDRGLLVQSQRDTGSGSGATAMAPTLFEYDAFANLTKETWKLAASPTLSNSRITAYAYAVENREDGIYRIATATKNNGKGTTYLEKQAELISSLSPTLASKLIMTDGRGNDSVQWTEYAGSSIRESKSQVPTSTIAAVTRTVDGFVVNATDNTGVTVSYTRAFTSTGIHLQTIDGRGNTTHMKQNMLGWTEENTDAAGNVTITEYDLPTGNPSVITDALGKTACYAYDARGRKTAEWGTAIQPVSFSYDDADRLAALTTYRAEGEEISSNPTGRTDGDTTTWAYYNASGMLISKTYEDGSHEDYQYNGLNMVASKTDLRGIVTTFTWDTAKGVCLKIEFGDGTPAQQFTYNNIGNMYRAVDAQGTRDITYNVYNEKETDSVTVNGNKHTVTETFDTFGRPTGYVLSKGASPLDTVTYAYGAEGRLASTSFLHGGEEKAFTYAYLPGSGLLHTVAHPNNILITRTYEELRDLATAMNATRGATNVVLRGYAYDELGRPVTRTCSRQAKTRNDSFAYNDRGELVSASLGTVPYAYAYDNTGNRETSQNAEAERSYAVNSLNQYTSITGTEEPLFVPQYDEAGNQTLVKTKTGIWTVIYDANNRPTCFTSEGGETVVDCGYDHLGRRFMKKVTVNGAVTLHHHYLYRGNLQIAALDLTRSNVPALWYAQWDPSEPLATRPLSLRKNGTWYTYGHDLTKNVTELYNANGTIATAYDYTPFGEASQQGTDQPFQWSSEVYDAETALVYYNYRHYNPLDGRWTARDPIGEQGGINLYEFVRERVSYLTDYLGKNFDTVTKIPGGPMTDGILPYLDDKLDLPLTLDVRFNDSKISEAINKMVNKELQKLSLSYAGKKMCELTAKTLTPKLKEAMKNGNFMGNNQAEIYVKLGDVLKPINDLPQGILGILNGATISSNKSFSLSATLNIPLCDVANKQIGVTVSDVMSVGAQKNSLTPQNNWNAAFGLVDKFGYSVKANVRLIDFNVGDVTVSCEGSATVSGSDFRNIKVGGEVKAQLEYNF